MFLVFACFKKVFGDVGGTLSLAWWGIGVHEVDSAQASERRAGVDAPRGDSDPEPTSFLGMNQ